MEINEIGEFGLIDRLTKGLPTHNASTLMGPGDDCAVIDSGDKLTLITSQLFMEGVQFDLTYIDMEHLAYKAVMATISNVFAMNGTPRQLTVSIGRENGLRSRTWTLSIRACKRRATSGELTS